VGGMAAAKQVIGDVTPRSRLSIGRPLAVAVTPTYAADDPDLLLSDMLDGDEVGVERHAGW
jgi:hypothetical protein